MNISLIPSWIKNYKKQYLSGDLSAGLIVGIMLIPQGMAYAMLAGLPPIYGLYASGIPLIIYAILGSSPQLAVGPVAMIALLISSGLSAFADPGSPAFIEYAILLSLMVGSIQLVLGLLRLGFLVNFLSHPVISGFTSAAAIIIALSQLKHVFGIDVGRGEIYEIMAEIFHNIGSTSVATLIIAIASFVVLILSRKISRKIPGPLLVVIIGIAAVYYNNLSGAGVKIVADIPQGFPAFKFPEISFESIKLLLPLAITISVIGYLESFAVAKAIERKHKTYEVSPNRELVALGLANTIGSFFKSFPVTGGFSRTAVNDQSGANSGLSSIISAGLIILTLLFLTPLFYYLPNAVLAAIIIVAVIGLIDYKEAIHLYRYDKLDFALFMITAIGTLALGIEIGIFIGVVLSLGVIIYEVSFPHIAELGQLPGKNEYRNLDRFPELEERDNFLIVRIDAPIFFANINHIKEFLYSRLKLRPEIKHIIFDASAISSIDSSGIHMLKDLLEDFDDKNIHLIMVQTKGPLRDILSKNELLAQKTTLSFALTIPDAIENIESQNAFIEEPYLFQSNKNI